MLPLLFLLAARDTTGYWQQQVAYRITASLDEASGVLTGRERIAYVNHSRATLLGFYLEQSMNAFRPRSRWGAADPAERRDRFERLGDPDYGFERITAATLMGEALPADYPYAPDSTIAHWTLPRPLAPGDSMVVEIEWQARPSTVPWPEGRQGRRFDFEQWYPKVVVFDRYGWEDHPLYPAGAFYGEFATYDVTLDLPRDQVIGATGVPVEGDPGWEHARADTSSSIDYQRDYYFPRPTPVCPELRLATGRKCVHFHAERVHHFAFSLNPQYVYEEGRYGDAVVRVLYPPSDRAAWGNGAAVRSTVIALAWLDSLYGTYQWPQLTTVDRIKANGATEFAMMVVSGGATAGPILDGVGRQYSMGQLANNEWREAWLDKGLTGFQTSWFFETRGVRDDYAVVEANVLARDLDAWSEPISMVSEHFRDRDSYTDAVYNRASLFFYQLRFVVGDEVMRRILRTYFARWKLKHVDEDAFRAVAEEVSGQDLKWLFAQWLHSTPLIDYRLRRVERRRLPDGRWHTAVTIERRGDGWMPVEIGDGDTIYARATGERARERIEFLTTRKPARLMLDPRVRAHDYDMLNNREPRWGVGRAALEVRLDDPTRETARRDRLVTAWLPVGWSNDFGGATIGLRQRSNYLGRFDRGLLVGSVATRTGATSRWGVYGVWSNPVGHPRSRTKTSLGAWALEGRVGVMLSADRSLRERLGLGADPHVGFDALWVATTDTGYLDHRLWDDAGTVEAGPWVSTAVRNGSVLIKARLGVRVGMVYFNPGLGVVSTNRYDVEPFGRSAGEASIRMPFWFGATLGLRAFAGGYLGSHSPVKQRRILIAGADPYETFANPFLRSRGSLFVRPDFHYQAAGNANLRAFRSDLGGRWAVALNTELSRAVFQHQSGMLRELAVEGFFDFGFVDTVATRPSRAEHWYQDVDDAGIGVVVRQQVGDLPWTLRLELPFVMSAWDLAPDFRPPGGRVQFRWLVSLAPIF